MDVSVSRSDLAAIENVAREHGLSPSDLIAVALGLRATEPPALTVPTAMANRLRECAAVLGIEPQEFADLWLTDYKRLLAADDPDGELAAWVDGRVRGFDFASPKEQAAARKRFAARLRAAGVEEARIRRKSRPNDAKMAATATA